MEKRALGVVAGFAIGLLASGCGGKGTLNDAGTTGTGGAEMDARSDSGGGGNDGSAGGAGGSGGDAGTTTFACGSGTCVNGQSFCYSFSGGVPGSGTSRSCMAVPAACTTNPSCACICPPNTAGSGCTFNGPSCSCTESNGTVTVSCFGA